MESKKLKHRWIKYIGCSAVFDKKGKLNILQNAKVIKFALSFDGHWIIVGEQKGHIIISSKFGMLSSVKNRFVKII